LDILTNNLPVLVSDHQLSCSVTQVSQCDRYVAYTVDMVGAERFALHVWDTRHMRQVGSVIEGLGLGGCEWAADGALMYTRLDGRLRPASVHRHTLGTDPQHDPTGASKRVPRGPTIMGVEAIK